MGKLLEEEDASDSSSMPGNLENEEEDAFSDVLFFKIDVGLVGSSASENLTVGLGSGLREF